MVEVTSGDLVSPRCHSRFGGVHKFCTMSARKLDAVRITDFGGHARVRTLLSGDSAGRRVVVKYSDLVSVVAPIRHLEPRTRANGRRQLLNCIANGLGSVKKAAVPKSAAPLSCEQLGRRRVVEIRHVARPIVGWRDDSRRRRDGHGVCAAGVIDRPRKRVVKAPRCCSTQKGKNERQKGR
jgi:hypothetical protein